MNWWSLHEEINLNNAFLRTWLFYMKQDRILITDLRKAILQKPLNISSGIKRFVEDEISGYSICIVNVTVSAKSRRINRSWSIVQIVRVSGVTAFMIHLVRMTNEYSGVRRSRLDLAYQHRHWAALGPAQFGLNVLSRSRYSSCSYVTSKKRKWVGGCLNNRAQRVV